MNLQRSFRWRSIAGIASSPSFKGKSLQNWDLPWIAWIWSIVESNEYITNKIIQHNPLSHRWLWNNDISHYSCHNVVIRILGFPLDSLDLVYLWIQQRYLTRSSCGPLSYGQKNMWSLFIIIVILLTYGQDMCHYNPLIMVSNTDIWSRHWRAERRPAGSTTKRERTWKLKHSPPIIHLLIV